MKPSRKRAVRRSSKLPERQDKGRQLGPRNLSHLRTKCLWLLPSGPDQVHTVLPQKVSFFNTATQSSTRFGSPLKTASPPHEGDFGYRTPLTSRLHGCFRFCFRERPALKAVYGSRPPLAAGKIVAERAGFEPARQGIPTYTLSKRALSATQTPLRMDWRRGRDSNPRAHCWANGFRDRPDRPLRHLSVLNSLSRSCFITCFVARSSERAAGKDRG